MNIKIINLVRSLNTNLVTEVHWVCTKSELKKDGQNIPEWGVNPCLYSAENYGSIGLPAKDPSDPTFVAYEDITEAQAIEWVKKAMGAEQLAELEANLDSQIEAQKHPTQASGVPWQSEPTPTNATNVNTATKDELRSLSGVDAVRAQAIIDGRPWSSTTDLATIQGISSDMIAGWYITV